MVLTSLYASHGGSRCSHQHVSSFLLFTYTYLTERSGKSYRLFGAEYYFYSRLYHYFRASRNQMLLDTGKGDSSTKCISICN